MGTVNCGVGTLEIKGIKNPDLKSQDPDDTLEKYIYIYYS